MNVFVDIQFRFDFFDTEPAEDHLDFGYGPAPSNLPDDR